MRQTEVSAVQPGPNRDEQYNVMAGIDSLPHNFTFFERVQRGVHQVVLFFAGVAHNTSMTVGLLPPSAEHSRTKPGKIVEKKLEEMEKLKRKLGAKETLPSPTT